MRNKFRLQGYAVIYGIYKGIRSAKTVRMMGLLLLNPKLDLQTNCGVAQII